MIYFARTVLNILLPPSSPLIMVLAGWLLMRKGYKKCGRILVCSGFSILYLLSTGLVSNLLIKPLENDYRPYENNNSSVDAIVILTSGVRDLSHMGMDPAPDSTSLYHLVYGIKIYREMDGVPLIISGGRADQTKPDLSIGEALGNEAIKLGVAIDDLSVEDDSKNTYAGALNVYKMLKGKSRIVLITSAYHMGRSVMLYKRAGFEVAPAPTNFIGEKFKFTIHSFIPGAGSLGLSSRAIYEYLSRLWYKLKGF